MREGALPEGTVVGGRFTVQRLIGQGGMGEVYAATSKSGEAAALKILQRKSAEDPDIVARFHREADIAKQVKSPYVAAVLGSGKDKDGRLWIAFERLVGEGLDERLRREQYLSFSDVAPIVSDGLKGLRAAHLAGVVHRDIKPGNLFVEKRPDQTERTRILDFGISKLRRTVSNRSEPSLTAFDATLGSFAYMAPEQVRGSARVDQRADLYALGAVAFRALAGRLPFEGHNALTLIALKLDRDPPTLASITGDEWPASMERFMSKIMARERERRFSTADDAMAGWRRVCDAMGGSALANSVPSLVQPREEDEEEDNTVVDDDFAPSNRYRR